MFGPLHILKPAGTGSFETLPVVEWAAMELGLAAGFDTASAATPDQMPRALVVEQFDIREGLKDSRMLALEDFYTVLYLPPSEKYDGAMERRAPSIRYQLDHRARFLNRNR